MPPDRTRASRFSGRRALLVINRKSRSGDADLNAALSRLRDGGIELLEQPTNEPRTIPDLVRRHGREVDFVIAAGGDGTINAIVDAVLEIGLPLGILPLGTANDLARTLEIPSDLDGASQVILAGRRRGIDVGRVNGKHFLNVAGIGLSVEVARTLDAETKQRLGLLGYPLAVIRTLGNRRTFRARVCCDGDEVNLRSVQLSVGNGRYYGGGLTVAPDAAIDDGWLDLFSIAPTGPLRLLMLGPALKRGSHGERDEVRLLRGRRIEIETSRPMPVNTDGEVTTRTPARFDVLPGALQVLAADPVSTEAGGTNRNGSATAH